MSRWPSCPWVGLAARLCLCFAGAAGMLGAWVSFDWLGNSWDHCDYPEECLDTWFPHAFRALRYLSAASVLFGALGVFASLAMRRRRADVLTLGVCWVVLFVSLAVTPMRANGNRDAVVWGEPFLWDIDGYRVVGVIVAVVSAVIAWKALQPASGAGHTPSRGSRREPTQPMLD